MKDDIEIPEGFVRWDGGEQPTERHVDYIMRGWPDEINHDEDPCNLRWDHLENDASTDIIAYRVVK